MRFLRRALALVAITLGLTYFSASGQELAPVVPNPDNGDTFQLNDLDSYRQFSSLLNFEIVGHSYFRGPWVVNDAPGGGFNTLRICDNTAYLSGYDPTVFGTLMVDVSDPANMRPLSFIPVNPGTRSSYLRVDCSRKILAAGHSRHAENPNRPPPGEPAISGVSFYDVSDPRNPVQLSQWNNAGGRTHGMEMDETYLYVCATTTESKPNSEEVIILDYTDPRAPTVAATYHVPGQHRGDTYAEMNQLNPNGTTQSVTCHEIIKDGARLYVAYRDAGLIILEFTGVSRLVPVGVFDYSPPFSGDPGIPPGCCPGAHTAAPVPHEGSDLPRLVVLTDEHFECPPGFGRILDISNLDHIQVLSTFHVAGVDDQYDLATGSFVCPPGRQSTHLPYFDPRGHGSLVYQAWYDQGLRALDISNPFRPTEVGYYVSPPFPVPGRLDSRHTREAYVDPATNLIYVTDGNGGGITVLRYTGPIQTQPPLPGVR